MNRVHATTVACGKAISITYCVCIFVDLVNQHKVRAQCCPLQPVWLEHIFPHYLINYTLFIKMWLNIKYVLWFSLQLLFKTFPHYKKKSVRCDQQCTFVFMQSTHYSWPILMELGIFSTHFQKILKCHLSWKSVQWEPSWSIHTNGQTDITKPILAICNFPNMLIKRSVLLLNKVFMSSTLISNTGFLSSVCHVCNSMMPSTAKIILCWW